MDRLEAMRVLVAVADEGGFSAAARRLGMPLATVSRKVAELEEHLRVQLLTRSTRRVALTAAAEAFVATGRRILDDLGEAERLVTGEYQAPRGHLVVAAPLVLGRVHLGPLVADFLEAYPDVTVELRLTDRTVQLVEDQVDLAVTIGDLPDSSLKAIPVGRVRPVVMASPAYLARHGMPATPDDLQLHNCVGFVGAAASREWEFVSNSGPFKLPLRPRLSVNTAEAAADAAIAGVGVTRLFCHQISGAVTDGRLKVLLKEYWTEPETVHLLFSGARATPQKLKAFIDFVVPRLKPRLVFDP